MLNMALIFGVLKSVKFIQKIIGPAGTKILNKVFGIILLAIAVKLFSANAKNLFPSNIAGLPTWYQIRVSPGGWQTMAESWQILLTSNLFSQGKITFSIHSRWLQIYTGRFRCISFVDSKFDMYCQTLEFNSLNYLLHRKVLPIILKENLIFICHFPLFCFCSLPVPAG